MSNRITRFPKFIGNISLFTILGFFGLLASFLFPFGKSNPSEIIDKVSRGYYLSYKLWKQ